MRGKGVAKRYAAALFSSGEKEGRERQYLEELKSFLSLLDERERIKGMILLPLIEMEKRRAILMDVVRALNLSPQVSNLLLMLLERNNLSSLPDIVGEYLRILDEREGRVRATLFTAFPLQRAEVEKIKAILKERLGKEVVLEVREEKALISGLRLKIGDTIIDGSVRRQLEVLQEILMRE